MAIKYIFISLIRSMGKPLRMKIRNICGDETIYLL